MRKHSRQRDAVLELLKSVTSHPTADWLYWELKKDLPDISLATVYRNLKLLVEDGTIIEIDVGDGQKHYDGNPHNHYHFFCKSCRKVIDIPHLLLEEMEDTVGREGHKVDYHRVEFYGTCSECV